MAGFLIQISEAAAATEAGSVKTVGRATPDTV